MPRISLEWTENCKRLGKWLKLSQQMNNGDLARCKRTNKVLALSIKENFDKK